MAVPILLLEDADVIQSTDYVRQLELLFEGQSDHISTTSTYGGGPLNHLTWIEVHRWCPAWVGRTVGEFRARMASMERPHQQVPGYEFVRGVVPTAHILSETAQEKYNRLYQNYTITVGKYKGKRAGSVKASDLGYFSWAVDQGIIPYDVWQSLNQFE